MKAAPITRSDDDLLCDTPQKIRGFVLTNTLNLSFWYATVTMLLFFFSLCQIMRGQSTWWLCPSARLNTHRGFQIHCWLSGMPLIIQLHIRAPRFTLKCWSTENSKCCSSKKATNECRAWKWPSPQAVTISKHQYPNFLPPAPSTRNESNRWYITLKTTLSSPDGCIHNIEPNGPEVQHHFKKKELPFLKKKKKGTNLMSNIAILTTWSICFHNEP